MVAKQTFDARVYCPHKTAHERVWLGYFEAAADTNNTKRPTSLSVLLKAGVIDRPRKGLVGYFEAAANTNNTERTTSLSVLLKVGVQGLRSSRNRSILCVCEDFGSKRNAAITF